MKTKKQRFVSFIVAMVMIAIPFNVFAASGLPSTTSITSGKCYYLRNANSGHYLDAENSKNNNVIQYGYHGALNQTWKLIQIATNTYRLENQSPYYQTQGRKCLSVSEVNDDVDLYYYDTSLYTQQWYITKNSDGTYKLKSKWDNKVLQVKNSATASPCDVVKATDSGISSQKWHLERIPDPNITRASLETAFPDAKFWNHTPGTSGSYTSIGTSACTHHNGGCTKTDDEYDGKCGCNCYRASIQCNGFAKYMGYRVFGSDITTWTRSFDSGSMYFVKPGDYIRYDGHSVFVVNIRPNLNEILVVECNFGSQCRINWYRIVTISEIMSHFDHIYKSPYVYTF